jgi:hypothetical protein
VNPGFLTPLEARKVEGTADTWKLLSSLVYWREAGTITVPMGFVTDFASTPRPVWMFMPKSGEYDAAAVVHDYLYVKGGVLPQKTYSKAEADAIFLEALEVCGVGRFKRWLMYQGVRIGGRGNF